MWSLHAAPPSTRPWSYIKSGEFKADKGQRTRNMIYRCAQSFLFGPSRRAQERELTQNLSLVLGMM